MSIKQPVQPTSTTAFGSKHFVADTTGRAGLWEWSAGGGGSWMRKSRGCVTFVKPEAAAALGWRYVAPCAH
jgi:hypothetical protein